MFVFVILHSLVNLKSLKKRRANKCDTDDSDTEDSSDVGKNKSRKITKKDKIKEQEQKLINFFNQMDDDGKICSQGARTYRVSSHNYCSFYTVFSTEKAW